MPTARESLLDAAQAALHHLPWSGVRMVDVAAAAGLSRQTLYNEFGSKDGLARALLRREADPLVALAEWTVGQARTRPLLRALLTGCWGERLPEPRPVRMGTVPAGVPAQRRADAGLPAPAEVVALVRDRSLAVLGPYGVAASQGPGPYGQDVEEWSRNSADRCELAMRLALSCVIAPAADGVGTLVRRVVGPTPPPRPVPPSAFAGPSVPADGRPPGSTPVGPSAVGAPGGQCAEPES